MDKIMSQEVLEFINNFDKDYLERKSYIFEQFEYDAFTLEEQKYTRIIHQASECRK